MKNARKNAIVKRKNELKNVKNLQDKLKMLSNSWLEKGMVIIKKINLWSINLLIRLLNVLNLRKAK